MKTIIIYGKDKMVRDKIIKSIDSNIPQKRIKMYNTLENLSNHLRSYSGEQIIAILVTATKNELMNILLLKDWFNNIPSILVLPDRSKETFSSGSKLVPRFISYIDGDLTEVGLVAQKMIEKQKYHQLI